VNEKDSLKSIIGGRWAVSWQGYLLGLPFAVAFIFFSLPSIWAASTVAESVLKVLGVGVGSYAAVGVVYGIAALTVLRNRTERPVSVITVALVGGAAWVPRALLLEAYTRQLQVTNGLELPELLVLGVLQGMVAAVLAAWILGTMDSFRRRRQILISELVEQELAADRLTHDIETLRADVVESVQLLIHDAERSVTASTMSAAPSAHDVQILREASGRITRDVAHRLWQDAESSTRLKLGAIVRSAVANRPFAFWAFIPIVTVSLARLADEWPVSKAALLLLAPTALSTGVSFLANHLTPRLPARSAMAVYAVAVLVLIVGSPMLLLAVMPLLNLTPPSGMAIVPIAVLNFGVLIPLLGIAAHVGTAQEKVLARLRRSIDVSEVDQEALRREEERLRRDLAVALHGGLQAELTALSMRAQSAVDAGDTTAARELLAQAQSSLGGWAPQIGDSSGSHASVQEVVDAVALAWSGLVDVKTSYDIRGLPSQRSIKAIEDVVLEGVGNAVRHGKAQHIEVKVTQEGQKIQVAVIDDGVGTSASSRGLGSAMFDRLAPGSWALATGITGGSVLTVTLAVVPTP
jgi:signal transduction histidine kinase